MEILNDPRIIAAFIAALTSIIVTFITKLFLDRMFYNFQLRTNYTYEQRSQIQSVIGRYKMPLVNACESLSHRLGNLWSRVSKNEKPHFVNGKYFADSEENDYIQSFVYRILAVFGWIKILKKDLIYLDTTNSQKDDLELIKFFTIFKAIFSDHALTIRVEKNPNKRKEDHLRRNQFEDMVDFILNLDKSGVIPFSEFKSRLTANKDSIRKELTPIFQYMEGMNPNEDRNRWHILSIFHLAIIAFINSYGYDFQKVELKKIQKYEMRVRGYKLKKAFFILIKRTKLNKQKDLKRIIKNIHEKNWQTQILELIKKKKSLSFKDILDDVKETFAKKDQKNGDKKDRFPDNLIKQAHLLITKRMQKRMTMEYLQNLIQEKEIVKSGNLYTVAKGK